MRGLHRARASQRTPPPYRDLEIKQTLGEGSFGRVKMVIHTPKRSSTEAPKPVAYALKMLSKQGMANKKQVKAILAELRVLLLIDHPFLLHLHGTYQSRDLCYFLFDCIQGGELFKRLASSDDCTIPFRDAQFYASHLIEALVYLQKKRVVYRDLKPENILIDTRGYVRAPRALFHSSPRSFRGFLRPSVPRRRASSTSASPRSCPTTTRSRTRSAARPST